MLWTPSCTSWFMASLVVATVLGQMTLQDSVTRLEDALATLVRRSEAVHAARCGDMSRCRFGGSIGCSVPACGNTFPENRGFDCFTDFGLSPNVCVDAPKPGLVRSFNDSVVRLPPGADFQESELQAFVCSSRRINREFLEHRATGKVTSWQYVSHAVSGGIRIYPGAPQERSEGRCDAYDPRIRPWYIQAASGPRDVVLVVDSSGSMLTVSGASTRFVVLQAAVTATLRSLSPNDFVSVVLYNEKAWTALQATTLVRATAATVELLVREIENTAPRLDSNLAAGMATAFDVLRASTGTANSSSCIRSVLVFSDGLLRDGMDFAEVATAVAAGQQGLSSPAKLFTYSIGTDTRDDGLKSLACTNDGVWDRITNRDDPLRQMRGYVNYLATNVDSTTVRWTAPYIDAFGLGQMVTGSRAVYDRSQADPILIGVVGIDITIDYLRQFANFSAIIAELNERSSTCESQGDVSECTLQNIRQQSSGYTCPNALSLESCRSRLEIVSLAKCRAVDSVNDFLCEPMSEFSRVAASGAYTTPQVACCGLAPPPSSAHDLRPFAGPAFLFVVTAVAFLVLAM